MVVMYQGKGAEEVRHNTLSDMEVQQHFSGMAERYCEIYGCAASYAFTS
jgi:hypothetical protein